jgi:site-specific recombinase XerD
MKADFYFNQYRQYLIDNNYSASAITAYCTGLKLFNDYLDKNSFSIKDLTISNINGYIDLLKYKLSPSSQSVYLNGVKNYLSFVIKLYNLHVNFDLKDIKQIKLIKKKRESVDITEVTKVLQGINFNSSIELKRDYLIIILILKTGLRITELVKIKHEDVTEGCIFMDGRKYFIDKKIFNMIVDYKKEKMGKIKNTSDYVFVPFLRCATSNNLTPRSVDVIIRRYFNNYSYNDLKSVYYKSLIDELPNITQIHKHGVNTTIISLQEIDDII